MRCNSLSQRQSQSPSWPVFNAGVWCGDFLFQREENSLHCLKILTIQWYAIYQCNFFLLEINLLINPFMLLYFIPLLRNVILAIFLFSWTWFIRVRYNVLNVHYTHRSSHLLVNSYDLSFYNISYRDRWKHILSNLLCTNHRLWLILNQGSPLCIC